MLIFLQMIDSPEEKSKFEQLYLEYRGLMFHVANVILNNSHDAEDAVHSAFLSIAENIGKVDVPVSDKTKHFVVIITENKAIDLYRYNQRHPKVPYEQTTIGLKVEYDGRNAIVGCIAKLPPLYRNALILKYQYGFKNREIAKILHTTTANAAKLVQRAKSKLAEYCLEEGITK